MKYCLDYHKGCRYINKCDQINFTYTKRDMALMGFLQEHAHQRVNVIILNINEFIKNNDIKLFEAIYAQHSNFVLRFGDNRKATVINDDLLKILAQTSIPFYFGDIITNWDQFNYFINLGISDIILGEEICFEIDKAAAVAHSKNILVHVYPNVAQSAINQTPAHKKFFIRPEDIPIYEPFVDVCEFWGDLKKLSVYYKIYAVKKKWLGNLSFIIIGLHSNIANEFVLPLFAQMRCSCGKKCLKGENCATCDQIVSIVNNMTRARDKAAQQL